MKESGVEVMTKEDWIACVKTGIFIPDDGVGYWGNSESYSRNDWCFESPPEGATHVHWFNK